MEDVEVIVRGVAAGVALCADGGTYTRVELGEWVGLGDCKGGFGLRFTKNDEVLRDT